MIGLATIAYSNPRFLMKMADTAFSIADVMCLYLFNHSQDPEVIEACYGVEAKYPTVLFDYRKNRGVARSWNDAIIAMSMADCDSMIITNDDIWFTPGDIAEITRTAKQNPEAPVVFCSGWHDGYDAPVSSHGMACFAINPIAVRKVGFFDQNFFPAYNEDVDYAYRIKLAGLKGVIAENTMVHHTGSVAIRTIPGLKDQNKRTHTLNNEYWWNKWQCNKDGEVGFKVPFDNEDFHPHQITLAQRHAPYLGHNRVDQEIVRI